MIHYSWLSACVEPGFLLPFKISLTPSQISMSTACNSAAALSGSLLTRFLCALPKPPYVFFQITSSIYSVSWDQQTRWPLDYQVLHIQIHCLKFPMAKPVQVLA